MGRGQLGSMLVTALLVVSCAGTSTGNPVGDPEPPGPGLPDFCKTETRELGDSEPAPELGFSAADVYALALGSHSSSLQWLPDDRFQFGPETGVASLTIDVSKRGKPRVVLRHLPDDPNLPPGVTCESRIEVDVRVRLRSSGGALDETIDATLRASHADEARLGYGQVDADRLNGTLELITSDSDTTFFGWLCEMTFTKTNLQGTLDVNVAHETARGSESTAFTLAQWPAD